MTRTTITTEQRTKIEEILRSLDGGAASRDVVNRRRASRVRIRAAFTGHLLTVPGHPSLILHTRNISTSGIGFVSRRPFSRGELLVVELDLIPRQSKMILAESTFSRYIRDGMYENGCEFRESIAREEFAARYSREKFPAHWLEMAAPKR